MGAAAGNVATGTPLQLRFIHQLRIQYILFLVILIFFAKCIFFSTPMIYSTKCLVNFGPVCDCCDIVVNLNTCELSLS